MSQNAQPIKKQTPATTRIETLLPLEDKTVSTFMTQTETGSQGRFMLEIYRPSEYQAELSIAGKTETLLIGLTGIEHAIGGYLLKEPLVQGNQFRGQFGEVTITRSNLAIDTPAGHFENCLETIEESQSPPKRASSIFCPNVGLTHFIVESEATEDLSRLEAQLLKHEKRVDLVDSSPDLP